MKGKTMGNNKPIRDFFRSILNKTDLAGIIQLYVNSAIKDNGWFKSYKTKESVDKNGNPIPWNTYPFLSFIEQRLKPEFDVFEYGSGNSTIWYAQKVNSIIAVEHNKEWYEKVKLMLPKNAEVVLSSETDSAIYGGEITARTMKSNNADNFLSFLKKLDRKDRNKNLHIIADNLAVHKYKEVKNWLSHKRKITLHFSPTYSSWLNQVKMWFNILTKDVIRGGIWTSTTQLSEQLREYIKTYNKTRAKPFQCT